MASSSSSFNLATRNDASINVSSSSSSSSSSSRSSSFAQTSRLVSFVGQQSLAAFKKSPTAPSTTSSSHNHVGSMIEASSPPLGPASSTIQSADHENEIDNDDDDDDTNKLYYNVYDADADADDRIMGEDHDDNEYEYEDYHEEDDDDDDDTMMIEYNMTYNTEAADDSGDCSSNNESGSGSIRSVMRIGEVFDTISEKHHSPTNSSTTSTSTTTTTNLTQTSSRQKQRKRQRQRQRLRNKALRLENKRDTLLKSTTRLPTAQTNQTIMNGNIRGGNSDTHRDCVSCVEGPITLPNSNFSDTQLHFSNVRIRCTACVDGQRHKINVTDQYQQLASPHHRDCNECGLFLPLKDFSTNELRVGKSNMICHSCCLLLPEREDELLRILAATTVRVCTVCGYSKPKRCFRWKELGLPHRLTITCVLCAERKKQQYRSDKSSVVHQQQPQLPPVSSERNNSNNQTKNNINNYTYDGHGHLQDHPHHVSPPRRSGLSFSVRTGRWHHPPTKRCGTSSKPKLNMLSPTSCTSNFIPAHGLTIDELLQGMTTVRSEQQQPNDEDRTYVVDDDDDDDDTSIQTTTTTMALLYPPPLQNTTALLVGWSVGFGFHNSSNTKKNKEEEEDSTTITVATTTTVSSTNTLHDDVQQQDSTHTNDDGGGGGEGRREGIESFLLGSLLDLDDEDSDERRNK